VLEDPGHVADRQHVEHSGDRAGNRKRRLLPCRPGQLVQQTHSGGWVRFPGRHGQPHQGDPVAPAGVLRGPEADRDDGSQIPHGRAVAFVVPAQSARHYRQVGIIDGPVGSLGRPVDRPGHRGGAEGQAERVTCGPDQGWDRQLGPRLPRPVNCAAIEPAAPVSQAVATFEVKA
jgi:hypothetical protein